MKSRENLSVKSCRLAATAWTQTEGSIWSCPHQLPFSPFLPSFCPFCLFHLLLLLNWRRENIFCFSFLGSDKMINGTNIGPDRAFGVRQNIKTKPEPNSRFFFRCILLAFLWYEASCYPESLKFAFQSFKLPRGINLADQFNPRHHPERGVKILYSYIYFFLYSINHLQWVFSIGAIYQYQY